MSDLVERVARAMAATRNPQPIPFEAWPLWDKDELRQYARAAVNLALEEAAKVALSVHDYIDADTVSAHAELMTGARIAAAIRALKEGE